MFRPCVLPVGRLLPASKGFKHRWQAGLEAAMPAAPFSSALTAGWVKRCRADRQVPVSPLTNLPLRDLELRPVRALRSHIASLRAAGLLPYGASSARRRRLPLSMQAALAAGPTQGATLHCGGGVVSRLRFAGFRCFANSCLSCETLQSEAGQGERASR